MVERVHLHDGYRLPDVTFCSAERYKSPGFHFNRSAFDRETYSFDEVFHPKAREILEKEVELIKNVVEVRAMMMKFSTV